MDIADAFQVVLDLASENILDENYCENPEMLSVRERQIEAINIITDLATNEYGDD